MSTASSDDIFDPAAGDPARIESANNNAHNSRVNYLALSYNKGVRTYNQPLRNPTTVHYPRPYGNRRDPMAPEGQRNIQNYFITATVITPVDTQNSDTSGHEVLHGIGRSQMNWRPSVSRESWAL
jgi:hypothetical protein